MSKGMMLENTDTKIRILTKEELGQVELYAKSYGFDVLEFNGDYTFSKALIKNKSLVNVQYSTNSPDYEVYDAHVYVKIEEQVHNLKELKRLLVLTPMRI